MAETKSTMTRRQVLSTMGAAAVGSVVATRLVEMTIGENGILSARARCVRRRRRRSRRRARRTYLNGWAGYGQPPRLTVKAVAGPTARRHGAGGPTRPKWSKVSGSGHGDVADPKAP
jgi:hypothetical protein